MCSWHSSYSSPTAIELALTASSLIRHHSPLTISLPALLHPQDQLVVELKATIQQLRQDNRQLAVALQHLATAATSGTPTAELLSTLPAQLLQDALAAGKPSTAPAGGRHTQQVRQKPRRRSSGSRQRRASASFDRPAFSLSGAYGTSRPVSSGFKGSTSPGPGINAYLGTGSTAGQHRRYSSSPIRTTAGPLASGYYGGGSGAGQGAAWGAASAGMGDFLLPASLPGTGQWRSRELSGSGLILAGAGTRGR